MTAATSDFSSFVSKLLRPMAANIYAPSDGEIVGIAVLGLLVICIILYVLYHLDKCREKPSADMLPQLQLNECREEEPASKSTIRYSEPVSTDQISALVAMRLNPFSRRGARHLGDHSECLVIKFQLALDWEEEGKRKERMDDWSRSQAEDQAQNQGQTKEDSDDEEESEECMMAEVTKPPAPRALPPVLRKIPYLPPILEICAVDDCSTHRSVETTIDTDRQAPPIPICDIEEGVILRAFEAAKQERIKTMSADRHLPVPFLDLEVGAREAVVARAERRKGTGGRDRGFDDEEEDSDEGVEGYDELFSEIELPDHHAMNLILDRAGSPDEDGTPRSPRSIKLPAARYPDV